MRDLPQTAFRPCVQAYLELRQGNTEVALQLLKRRRASPLGGGAGAGAGGPQVRLLCSAPVSRMYSGMRGYGLGLTMRARLCKSQASGGGRR